MFASYSLEISKGGAKEWSCKKSPSYSCASMDGSCCSTRPMERHTPLHRMAELLQRGDTEFMSLTGFFAPDVIRFSMYVAAAFALIRYSRMLAWLLCRDLHESRPSPSSLEEAPLPPSQH